MIIAQPFTNMLQTVSLVIIYTDININNTHTCPHDFFSLTFFKAGSSVSFKKLPVVSKKLIFD